VSYLQAILLLSLFFIGAVSQGSDLDSYRVLPPEGEFADHSIMLLKHLARQSQQRAWQREVELARIRDEHDWQSYRTKLLERYHTSLGLPFPSRTDLQVEVVQVLDRGKYRIENILYQSLPEIFVTANLYVPQTTGGPYPGILFPCGHSRNGKAYELYHQAALGLVQKGYVVLVYDPPGQGERYQYLKEDGTPLIGKPTSEHTLLANPLFLMGKHLMALRLWDAIRGIDYLQSRPEVDPERIGCTGNSGGGTVTLHLVPLEPRIKVAVAVGTVNSPYFELGTGYASDGEQNLPFQVPYGIAHADLMMLAYPRPYLLIKESRSRVRTGTRASFFQARFLYETLGEGERMSYLETEWPHGYFRAMREPMYEWFGKWLYQRENDYLEPEVSLENEEDLLCSESGQILNEKGMAIWQWAAEQLKTVLPSPAPPSDLSGLVNLRKTVKREATQLLNNPPVSEKARLVDLGELSESQLSIRKLALYSEEDIYLPILEFGTEKGRKPTVILLDSEGKTQGGIELAKRLAIKGWLVWMADLRGMGETAGSDPDPRDAEGSIEARILGDEAGGAYDGLRLGRSIFAMRVFDLLQIVDYLGSQNSALGDAPIAVVGRNSCGPIALYAALLDNRIQAVVVEKSLALFSDLVTSRDYTWHFMDFLPGVLAHHDLPQVVGSLAPRPVWVVNPLNALKKPNSSENVSNAYLWASECYRLHERGSNFQIHESETEEKTRKVLLDWAASIPGD